MGLLPKTKTAGDVIDRVKRQFGDEAGVQVTETDILSHINSGQVEIARINNVLTATGTTTITQGVDEYAFPNDDILKVQSIRVNGVTLDHKSFQDAETFMLDYDPEKTARARPEFWYEWGGNLYLYPLPDKDYPLRIHYVRQPPPVADRNNPLTLPDVYFDAIVAYVMSQVYEMDEDWEATALKAQQYSASVNSLAEASRADNRAYPTITVLEDDL